MKSIIIPMFTVGGVGAKLAQPHAIENEHILVIDDDAINMLQYGSSVKPTAVCIIITIH